MASLQEGPIKYDIQNQWMEVSAEGEQECGHFRIQDYHRNCTKKKDFILMLVIYLFFVGDRF